MVGSTISACIVCRNEAAKLTECLDSVAWADEVVVLDLESDDASAAVARERGAKVISHPPHPIVEPLRDIVAEHARGAWVLALDPDERVTPGLAAALRGFAARPDIDAVVVPRTNVDFGWEPSTPGQRYEPQLRMYRRDRVRWPHFPNKLPVVPEDRLGRVGAKDDQVLRHLRNVDVAETVERLRRYAPAQAQAMVDAGQRFSAKAMFSELAKAVSRHFIRARAWQEGVPGLVRAMVLVNHHVYVWIAFWQLCGAERTPQDDATVARLGIVLAPISFASRLRHRARRLLAREASGA